MNNEILKGELIKLARENKNITQQELADHAGVTKSYISQIESNKKKNVKSELMKKICEILGLAFFEEKQSNPITVVDVEVDAKIAKLRADFQSNETEINITIFDAELLHSEIKNTQNSRLGDLELLLTEMYRKSLKYSEAYRYGISCSERFIAKGVKYSYCQAQFEIASMDMENGSYISSIERYKVVENYLSQIGIQNNLSHRTQVNIALIAIKLEDSNTAYDYLNRAKDGIVYIPNFNKERFRAVYDYIQGRALYNSGNYKDSIELHNSAYYLFKSIEDNRNSLRMKHNIAELYFKVGQINQAIEIARDTFEIKQNNESSTSIGHTANLLGEIYLSKDDFNKVYEFCHYSIDLNDIDPFEKANAYKLMASANLKENKLIDFEKNINNAMKISVGTKGCESLAVEISCIYMNYSINKN